MEAAAERGVVRGLSGERVLGHARAMGNGPGKRAIPVSEGGALAGGPGLSA